MPDANRAFLSQDTVDRWLADGSIRLDGEVLSIAPEGPAFRLESAVLFRTEVGSGVDALGLCGKVKTLPAVSALSGEHAPGSVVVGDSAYEVVEGFVGALVQDGGDGARGAWSGQRARAALSEMVERERAG